MRVVTGVIFCMLECVYFKLLQSESLFWRNLAVKHWVFLSFLSSWFVFGNPMRRDYRRCVSLSLWLCRASFWRYPWKLYNRGFRENFSYSYGLLYRSYMFLLYSMNFKKCQIFGDISLDALLTYSERCLISWVIFISEIYLWNILRNTLCILEVILWWRFIGSFIGFVLKLV